MLSNVFSINHMLSMVLLFLFYWRGAAEVERQLNSWRSLVDLVEGMETCASPYLLPEVGGV